jgi:hypothetical protein
VADLARRASLDRGDLQVLAAGNALHGLAGHRRQALWEAVGAVPDKDLLRPTVPGSRRRRVLAAPSEGAEIVGDYRAQGLTLGRHPLALLRKQLLARRFLPADVLMDFQNGQLARACGIVTVRQRPGTAKGVLFLTIEDETGNINVIVWASLVEQQRREVLNATLLGVYGCGSGKGRCGTWWPSGWWTCRICWGAWIRAAGIFARNCPAKLFSPTARPPPRIRSRRRSPAACRRASAPCDPPALVPCILVLLVARIVARGDIVDAQGTDAGNLGDVFARFCPMKMCGVGRQDDDRARRICFQFIRIEAGAEADVEHPRDDRIDAVFRMGMRHQLHAARHLDPHDIGTGLAELADQHRQLCLGREGLECLPWHVFAEYFAECRERQALVAALPDSWDTGTVVPMICVCIAMKNSSSILDESFPALPHGGVGCGSGQLHFCRHFR